MKPLRFRSAAVMALAVALGACGEAGTKGSTAPPVPPSETSAGVAITALPIPGATAARLVDVAGGTAVGWAEFPDSPDGTRHPIAVSIADGSVRDLGTFSAGATAAEADHITGTKVTGTVSEADGRISLFLVDLANDHRAHVELGIAAAPDSFAGPATCAVTVGVSGDELVFSVCGSEVEERWRSFAASLTDAAVRDLGAVARGTDTALTTVDAGVAAGWSGTNDAFGPILVDLATGRFTQIGLEPGDDLGLMKDAEDGWAIGWSYERLTDDDVTIAWNLDTGERRVVGPGLATATAGGWAVGARPDGTLWATDIASGRTIELGRTPVDTNLEPVAFDGRWLLASFAGSNGSGTVPVALDLADVLR